MRKPSKKSMMLLGASGVLAAGIAVPAIAYADATATPGTSASATGRHHGPDQDKLAAALAKELGVDQQKVADALAKVREELRPEQGKRVGDRTADHLARLKERLAEAVKAGTLTQAEADAIIKAHEAGVLGGPGGGHGPGPMNR